MKRKIEYVRVEGLFGSLTHTINLHAAGVTIIHGPNGCGKTTVLRLLDGVVNQEFSKIIDIPFTTFEIGIFESRRIKITRGPKVAATAPNTSATDAASTDFPLVTDQADTGLIIELWQSNEVLFKQHLAGESIESVYSKIIQDPAIVRKMQPTLRQIGPRLWRNVDTEARYSAIDVAQLLIDNFLTIPEWFTKALTGIDVGFINAQRLLDVSRHHGDAKADEKTSVRQFVEIYSDDIKLRINEALNKSAVISQHRERSFPERMLNKQYGTATKLASIQADYLNLQNRFVKLAETGLQEEIPLIRLPSSNLNPTERRVLALYLEDINEKLNVFSELQDQIDTLKTIVGKKFRRKSLHIDRKLGFALRDDTGTPLTPSALSSGEQHQLVMFYDLIFSKKSDLLFLVDEPEISLHVEWQRQFLNDLEAIASLKGHQFLIATHSPQVIGSRRQLAVALDGGVPADTLAGQESTNTNAKGA